MKVIVLRRHTFAALSALLLACAASLVFVAAGQATIKPDSDAPAGAASDWLPHEQWVDQRWLPFDETALNTMLGMSTQQIFDKLSATRQTLDDLARSRGVDTHGLAARLLASRHLRAGTAQRRTMLTRTRRVLTQSHLAAHLLGHVFHMQSVIGDPQRTFGVSATDFRTLYFNDHRTFLEIAATGGLSAAKLRARVLAETRAAGRQGVRAGAMSARENRILRARDAAGFGSWAGYRTPSSQTASITHGLICHLPVS
jgi:hypothetical protein